jgi:hypothetical protein
MQNKVQENKSFILEKLITKSQITENNPSNFDKKKQCSITSLITNQQKRRKKINP